MANLTPKQERFAQCIADGMSQADAYRASYKVRQGTKPETIQQGASRLMANSNVSARVAELQQKLTEVSVWRREDSVRVLAGIVGEEGATRLERVSAVKELNAMHGFNKLVLDHTSNDGTMTPTVINVIGVE